MPPDDGSDEKVLETAISNDEWTGPWGSIEPAPRSVETLCVQIEREKGKPCIYFYPYRTIGKWNWSMDAPETLEIQVGSVQLTISGTGLRRLAEALNLGQLRLVQQNQPPDPTGEIFVRSISIDNLKG